MKFCTNCGAEIDDKAVICPKCGVPVASVTVEKSEKKNPTLAAILSFLFPGLGQVYNGEIGKAIALFIAGAISAALILLVIGIVLYPIVWIVSIYDAYKTAKEA